MEVGAPKAACCIVHLLNSVIRGNTATRDFWRPDLEDLFDPPDEEQAADEPLLEWETPAAQRPGRDDTRIEEPDALGLRDIDRAQDWSPFTGAPPSDMEVSLCRELQLAHPTCFEVDGTASVEELNPKQRLFHDVLADHYRTSLGGCRLPRFLPHLDGRAEKRAWARAEEARQRSCCFVSRLPVIERK
ncbi:hypothetical protein N7461_006257 [Penicillium sp. DV-2018c]|nr:hypothetical protein N7461_006257 [Penicillium sp. DV-2018c]